MYLPSVSVRAIFLVGVPIFSPSLQTQETPPEVLSRESVARDHEACFFRFNRGRSTIRDAKICAKKCTVYGKISIFQVSEMFCVYKKLLCSEMLFTQQAEVAQQRYFSFLCDRIVTRMVI